MSEFRAKEAETGDFASGFILGLIVGVVLGGLICTFMTLNKAKNEWEKAAIQSGNGCYDSFTGEFKFN